MKIITIVGARPQFIKAAVVSRLFSTTKNITEIIVHTGQHFDANMSDVFFEEMRIPLPHYNLCINSLSHGAMTGQMLEKIEVILLKEMPDLVIVYGDTNSTIAGALAAKKLNIKLAHVEAGLRSFNMNMPEEINRILTDRISDILFCPTDNAVENLKNEGYKNIKCKIVKNGDVMQDAALFYLNKAKMPTFDIPKIFILCTLHRAENTDDITKLKNIFNALEIISQDIKVVLPLHPRTKLILKRIGYEFHNSSIHFISPVGYLEMVWLINNCELVVTDSGGLQKEAYFFKKYCVTLRDETEWIELVNKGYNVLAGNNTESIIKNIHFYLKKDFIFDKNSLYGEGDASNKILKTIVDFFK